MDPIAAQIAGWAAALSWSYAFVTVVPVLIAHAWLQLIKDRRRRRHLEAFDALAICSRGALVSIVVAFLCALFVEWPVRRAGLGALLVGAGYVVILIAIEYLARKRAPELAGRVIGDDATELAPFDGATTGEFDADKTTIVKAGGDYQPHPCAGDVQPPPRAR